MTGAGACGGIVPDCTSATATEAVAELPKEGAGGKEEAKGSGVTLRAVSDLQHEHAVNAFGGLQTDRHHFSRQESAGKRTLQRHEATECSRRLPWTTAREI